MGDTFVVGDMVLFDGLEYNVGIIVRFNDDFVDIRQPSGRVRSRNLNYDIACGRLRKLPDSLGNDFEEGGVNV